MPSEPIWERALSRYADTLYRLALLRDPHPHRAAASVERAFVTLDWRAAELDDTLEGRLVSRLPPPRRLVRPVLPPLSAVFWRLPVAARLALGLRLRRGYAITAIAAALDRPLEEVRTLLLRSLCMLAGEECDALPDACRATLAARLDEPAANRQHVLGCSRCPKLIPALEGAEQALAEAIAGATARAVLPPATAQAIRTQLHAGAQGRTAPPWRRPALLQAALVVVVLLTLAALVVPSGRGSSTGQPSSSARAMVEQALARYGLPPEGEGILHRRYRFDSGKENGVLQGEMWIDLAHPARHRMQLFEGERMREIQAGDGEQRLRYLSDMYRGHCGRNRDQVPLRSGEFHVWAIGADEQARMRDARWQFGTWGVGRRLLQQAAAADQVRSLGTIAGDTGSVLTLAAEGKAISGTLLLELDAQTAELREVREVHDDGGKPRSHTPWQILDEKRITPEQARQAGIFSSLPNTTKRRVNERRLPILDPACPLYGVEQAFSPPQTLGGYGGLFAFAAPPPATRRAFLVGNPGPESAPAYGVSTGTTVIYLGDDRRIALTTWYEADSFRESPQTVEVAGWLIQMVPVAPGRWEGQAVKTGGDDPPDRRFHFVAEGWPRDDLLRMLGTVKLLRLDEWLSQRALFYDPNPPPDSVIALALRAWEALEPQPSQVDHIVVEHEVREEPRRARLRDPYHREAPSGVLEQWVRYSSDGTLDRLRGDFQTFDGAPRTVTWGNSEATSVYDARANRVLRYDRPFANSGPRQQFDANISDIFRYEQYQVAETDALITLSATLPLTQTEFWNNLREQEQYQGAGWAMWPWLLDLQPTSITYRTSFDPRTARLQRVEIFANGPRGPTLIQRTALTRWDSPSADPPAGWRFEPPADTSVVEDTGRGRYSGRGSADAENLQEIIDAAPARLWGWEDSAARFLGGRIPPGDAGPLPRFAMLDEAIPAGAAVELRYTLGGPEEFTLLQGPTNVLRPILQNTPPGWLASEEQTLSVAGKQRTVWLTYNNDTRGAIVDIDGTLIVVRYRGWRSVEEWPLMLDRLVPLDDNTCLEGDREVPCAEVVPAEDR